MKVLVVDEALPYPTDSGKRIRTFELLRRLAPEFEIRLLFADEGGGTPRVSLDAVRAAGIEPVGVPCPVIRKRGLRFAWDLGRNLLVPAPYMVMAHRPRALRNAVADALATWKPDLVHVEWTPLLANVPEDATVPVCVSAHNVEGDIWARYEAAERRGPRRAYVRVQRKKVERYERAAFARADAVLAVSENDAARIRAWSGRPNVTVVPNGVDAAHFRPDPSAKVDPFELLFVGSLDWRPNQDAVAWALDEVLPAIRRSVPTATLSIVGRSPPADLVARAERMPGVRVHGSVPDVRPFVARAGISIVPLRIGGGSRLKICEALAMGRPVVSTTVGAEGLDLDGGVAIADDAEAFAAAVEAIVADPAAALARAARGRRKVLEANEWGSVAPIQARAWREAAAKRAAR